MTDRVGQHLGNYRLIRLLGRGGFAEVYLGEHMRLGTQAAVKVLNTRLASREDVEGFEKEAQTIAHLKHPHIVRVLDYDVEKDTPFLVMDYAVGGTLRYRYPKGTRLPLITIIHYAQQIADALQYAHDQRVIHRDVKPENMLVGEHNELLLSDFGIAIAAQSSHYQNTQNMSGTMSYIAPEQIQGHPRPASDQYSLGIVVYEWLSGNCPFHGSMTEIVAQHLAAPPPSLQEKISPAVSEVEKVIQRALEKDPYKRFRSIKAFTSALEEAYQKSVASADFPGFPSQSSLPMIMPKKQTMQTKLPIDSAYEQPTLQTPLQPHSQIPSPSGSVFGSPTIQSFPSRHPAARRRILILAISILLVASVLLVALFGNWFVIPGLVGTPSITATATIPHKSTPISTPHPKAGTILYRADWLRGLNGWVGTPDWSVQNGLLLNDGSGSPTAAAGPTIVTPYQIGEILNYAVEVRIQKVGGACFDPVTLRGSQETNGWHGYKISVCGGNIGFYRDDLNGMVVVAPFDPGNREHLYRAEARGPKIRVFIDGGLFLEGNDNTYLLAGQVGIKSSAQLIVSSFKIVTL